MNIRLEIIGKGGKHTNSVREIEDKNFFKTKNTMDFAFKSGFCKWSGVYNADTNELLYSVGKR